MRELFHKFSAKVSYFTGTPYMFMAALLLVIGWAASGPVFNFSNTWQLMINTGTTIGTFLMVFLIQNTQNRDGMAVQLKLDELIRASRTARSSFIDVEDLSDNDLHALDQEFRVLHEKQLTSPLLHQLHHKIKVVHTHRTIKR